MDPLGPTQHWVADRSAARGAAHAMLVAELRRGRLVLISVAIVLGLTVLLLTAGRTSDDKNPVLAFLFSLGLTAFLVGSAVGIAQLQRRGGFRAQLPPGLEMTSRFGPDFVVIASPWAESRLQFDGFVTVEVAGDWVLLLQRQRRVRLVFPRAPFPSVDLARLRVVVAGYQPREPAPPEEGPEDPVAPEA